MVLDPYFEWFAENFESTHYNLAALGWRPVVQFSLTVLAAREIMAYASDWVRRILWRRWRIDVSPPEAAHLSTTAYFAYLCFACSTVTFLVWPSWAVHTRLLLQKIAMDFAARGGAAAEALGSDDPL